MSSLMYALRNMSRCTAEDRWVTQICNPVDYLPTRLQVAVASSARRGKMASNQDMFCEAKARVPSVSAQ